MGPLSKLLKSTVIGGQGRSCNTGRSSGSKEMTKKGENQLGDLVLAEVRIQAGKTQRSQIENGKIAQNWKKKDSGSEARLVCICM